MYVVGAAVF